MRARAIAAFACVALVGSCAPPLPAPNIVDAPRVIAMIADPVVVAPGASVTVRAVVGGEGVPQSFRWTMCVAPRALSTSLQPQACLDQPTLRVLGPVDGERATFEIPADMDTIARWVFIAFAPSTNPTELFDMLTMRGLDLIVTAEGEGAGGVPVRASKRVVMSVVGTTPPTVAVPQFRFGGAELAVGTGARESCAQLTGAPVVVARGEYAQVEPEGMRLPQLSHFADGGEFEFGETRPDLVRWRAPETPGRFTHWLVAQRNLSRESGPGVSAVAFCTFDVEVP